MEYQYYGAFLVVHVGNELDHHRVAILQDEIEKAGRKRGYKHIIFDFSDTTFMDSSGVGMIISRYKRLSAYGGRVCVVGISPVVEKMFYVSGLHKIIRMYPEVEDVLDEKK